MKAIIFHEAVLLQTNNEYLFKYLIFLFVFSIYCSLEGPRKRSATAPMIPERLGDKVRSLFK